MEVQIKDYLQEFETLQIILENKLEKDQLFQISKNFEVN
jgi:hypothetical protein